MKRLYFILGLTLSLLLVSCEKDEDPIPPKDCTCQTVTNAKAYYTDTFKINITFYLDLRNDCNQKTARLYFHGWVGANPPKEWQEAKDSGIWCAK
jgi:hypothetical protein